MFFFGLPPVGKITSLPRLCPRGSDFADYHDLTFLSRASLRRLTDAGHESLRKFFTILISGSRFTTPYMTSEDFHHDAAADLLAHYVICREEEHQRPIELDLFTICLRAHDISAVSTRSAAAEHYRKAEFFHIISNTQHTQSSPSLTATATPLAGPQAHAMKNDVSARLSARK